MDDVRRGLDVGGALRRAVGLGGVVAWVPSLRWVYQGLAVDPMVREQALELARQRGWGVERIGHVRSVTAPLSTASR